MYVCVCVFIYIYIYSFIICLCVMVNDHLESLISRNIPVSDPFHPPVSQIPTPQRRTLARPPWLQGWNLMNGETNGEVDVVAGHGWSWQARRHVWIQHVFKPAST